GGIGDEPMDMFQAPAVGSEFRREPIEQFRLRRTIALRSEIFGRRDEAASEILLPDSTDDDARHGGMACIDEPLCEGEATGPPLLREWVEDRGNAGRNKFGWLAKVAALEDVGLSRLFSLGQNESRGRGWPLIHLLVDFLVGLGESLVGHTI